MISEMTTETTRGVVDKAIAIAVLVVLDFFSSYAVILVQFKHILFP
jgi:hypothetical protein